MPFLPHPHYHHHNHRKPRVLLLGHPLSVCPYALELENHTSVGNGCPGYTQTGKSPICVAGSGVGDEGEGQEMHLRHGELFWLHQLFLRQRRSFPIT